MKYEPEKYKEKVLPKLGETKKAKVITIDEGDVSDFVRPDVVDKFIRNGVEPKVLNIVAESQDKELRSMIVSLPDKNEVHPKSQMARWKRTYGEFPKEGQEVTFIADDDGYWQFYLKQ